MRRFCNIWLQTQDLRGCHKTLGKDFQPFLFLTFFSPSLPETILGHPWGYRGFSLFCGPSMGQGQGKVGGERVTRDLTMDWGVKMDITGGSRGRAPHPGEVHTSQCLSPSPVGGASRSGMLTWLLKIKTVHISRAQGCGRLGACESSGPRVYSLKSLLNFTQESELLELGPDLLLATEPSGRGVIPGSRVGI